MKGLLKRGDMDELLRHGARLGNLPPEATGFSIECSICRDGLVSARYEGDGLLECRCPRCNRLVCKIAIAEGSAQEKSTLARDVAHNVPPSLGGRQN